MTEPTHFDVAVIGAGIAGLVAATELARAGTRVVVIESAATVGGLLAPLLIDGVMVDAGAESFATRTESVEALIRDWDLPLRSCEPNPVGASLVLAGARGLRRIPLPAHTVLGLPAVPLARDVRRVIGLRGAIRAWTERCIPRGPAHPDGDLDTLVRGRYGRAVADLLLDPIVRGVYSAPASELTLTAVAPSLAARFGRGGSLHRAVCATVSGARAGSAVRSVRGGMWHLPEAIARSARAHGAELWCGRTITSLTRPEPGRVELLVEAAGMTPHRLSCSGVIFACPFDAVARLSRDLGLQHPFLPPTTRAADITLATVSLDTPALDRYPLGTGALIAHSAQRWAKALTHVNAKWPWLNEQLPAHRHIVRLSSCVPDDGWLHDRETVAGELSRLFGANIPPAAVRETRVSHWPAAATAPTHGMLDRYAPALTELAAAGCVVVGASVAGTGLATVIPHARATARTLLPTERTRS